MESFRIAGIPDGCREEFVGVHAGAITQDAIANFVTIIGIPFGWQHLKLAGIALAPIGMTVVTKEVAAAARAAGGPRPLLSGESNVDRLPRVARSVPQPAPDFLYFAYGSNMSSRRLTMPRRAPSATRVAVGYVPARRLTFDKFSIKDGSGKCDCEATGNPADRVYGVVYRIATSDRAALDDAEGLHRGYRHEVLSVIAGATTIHALAYVATDKRPGLPVFDWYLKHVLVGAVENGLPADYIETLRRVSTVVDKEEARVAEESAISSPKSAAALHRSR
jgi:gamma-glutamylcyclotransferase